MKESPGLASEAPTLVQEFPPQMPLSAAGSYSQPNSLRPVIHRRVANYLVFKKDNLRAI